MKNKIAKNKLNSIYGIKENDKILEETASQWKQRHFGEIKYIKTILKDLKKLKQLSANIEEIRE